MITEFEEYQKTGMLGSFHPESVCRRNIKEQVIPVFQDAKCSISEECTELEREMLIGDRHFIIRSVLPSGDNTKTPTDVLMRLIEEDPDL